MNLLNPMNHLNPGRKAAQRRNMMKDISDTLLQRFRQSYEADKNAQVLYGTLAKTDMMNLAYHPGKGAALKGAFTVEVKTRGLRPRNSRGAAGSLRR